MSLDNKVILVTGGAGSFGRKFAEVALAKHNPKAIRIYDNRELAAVEMDRKLQDPRLRFLIGDIRDVNRLSRAMNGVDIVVHAAALKHVPLCEYNPIEAVKTNIDGTANVIDAAINNGVKKAIIISTDKAALPNNLYGATKLVAEKLFIQGNSYVRDYATIFSCARYGNFLGSSGSVIPLFLEQKAKGELTITDERMTRFWVTLEQGVDFVIDSIASMKGGEIFVPKIPSMKIVDLAKAIAPEAKINIIGMRSGERIDEILLTAEEARHAKEFDTHFIIEPEFNFWDVNNHKDAQRPARDFEYSSHTNNQWLVQEDIVKIVKSLTSAFAAPKPKKVLAIIQARMGASRLPGKVLLDIEGKPMLSHIIDRVRSAKKIDDIVLSIPDTSENDILETFAQGLNMKFFRGSEHNVLSRFYGAAQKHPADIIVRITADNPFVDPELIDQAIESHIAAGADYSSPMLTPQLPLGVGVEVFDAKAFEKVFQQALTLEEKEHVTPYFYRNPGIFKINAIAVDHALHLPSARLTVDTQEDLQLARELYKKIYTHSIKEVISLLGKNPELLRTNGAIQQKTLSV